MGTRTLPSRVIAEHYGLELKAGDSIVMKLPTFSEIDRDVTWAEAHDWHFTYWPDGTKTIDFPKGRLRLPSPLVSPK